MGKLARSRFTFPEYVALEETSPIRHEYLDGVVYALAGASPDHAAVAANVIRLLGNALEGRPPICVCASSRPGSAPTPTRR